VHERSALYAREHGADRFLSRVLPCKESNHRAAAQCLVRRRSYIISVRNG
jgi:hypothetical protein